MPPLTSTKPICHKISFINSPAFSSFFLCVQPHVSRKSIKRRSNVHWFCRFYDLDIKKWHVLFFFFFLINKVYRLSACAHRCATPLRLIFILFFFLFSLQGCKTVIFADLLILPFSKKRNAKLEIFTPPLLPHLRVTVPIKSKDHIRITCGTFFKIFKNKALVWCCKTVNSRYHIVSCFFFHLPFFSTKLAKWNKMKKKKHVSRPWTNLNNCSLIYSIDCITCSFSACSISFFCCCNVNSMLIQYLDRLLN